MKFSDEQVKEILAGPQSFRVVPFPVHGPAEAFNVAVRCLSESELDGASVEAQRRIREIAKQRGWEPTSMIDVDPQLIARVKERVVIARAFFDADTIETKKPEPFFTSLTEVEQLPSVQVTSLMAVYLEHQQWVNPWRGLDVDEARELADALGKQPELPVYLGDYERNALINLCTILVSLLRST